MRLHPTPNRRTLPLLGLLLTLLCALAFPLHGRAQEPQSGVELTVNAGFDSILKQNQWLPLTVRAVNDGPDVVGTLRVATGAPATNDEILFTAPLSLPTQSDKRVPLLVYAPPFTNDLTVEFVDENGRVIQTATSQRLDVLAPEDLLYGVVTPEPGEFSFLERVTAGRDRAAVAFLALANLPETAVGWSALDVLVLNGVDTSQLTPGQREALQGWLDTGGQLVVTGGPDWQPTAAPLADLLPVTISGAATVDDLPQLATAVGVPFRDPGPYVVTQSDLRAGEALLTTDERPLLARRAQGQGAVYFLALDPRLAPLLDWDGSEQLWERVAQNVPLRPAWSQGIRNGYAATTAVSSIPTISLPSVLQLVAFLLVYIAIIGPLNYFVLKRLGRRELAWVTIPVLVLLFSGLTYFIGFRIKGNAPVVNQMAVATGHVAGEQMRVQEVLGLFSPRRTAYTVTLPPDSAARPLPDSFTAPGGASQAAVFARDTAVTIRDIRTDISDVATFIVDGYAATPALTGEAAVSESNGRRQLDVVVQNNSGFVLEDVSIVYGNEVFALGDLAPNEQRSLSQALAAPSAAGGPSPLFPARVVPGSPLLSNAEVVLGTPDFYNDEVAFPRWQLLQAIEDYGAAETAVAAPPDDVVTLVAWSDTPLLDVTLDRDAYESLTTTLFLLELPLRE